MRTQEAQGAGFCPWLRATTLTRSCCGPQASLSNLASHVILPTEDRVRTELGGPSPRGCGRRL